MTAPKLFLALFALGGVNALSGDIAHTCHPTNMLTGKDYFACNQDVQGDAAGTCLNHVVESFPLSKISNHKFHDPCFAYCEQRLRKLHVIEVPYTGTDCRGDRGSTQCVLEGGATVDVHSPFDFEIALPKDVFEKGASSPWIKDAKYFPLGSRSVSAKDEHGNALCGYWTFLPYFMESCGTITRTEYCSKRENGQCFCDKEGKIARPPVSTGNMCQKQLYINRNGNPDGISAFVLTDCKTGEKRPKAEQDPNYQVIME